MRYIICSVVFLFFGFFCKGQNNVLIINVSDSAISSYTPVVRTGNISEVIITQTNIAPLNKIYHEGDFILKNATIDTFHIQRTFFRNFQMLNCLVNSSTVLDSVPTFYMKFNNNVLNKELHINGSFDNYNISQFSFVNNRVSGNAVFSEIAFNQSVFDSSKFYGILRFKNCIVNDCSFQYVDFKDYLILENVNKITAIFKSSRFRKTLKLNNGIHENINFDSCFFDNNLDLSAIEQSSLLSFKYTSLPDTLDLSHNSNLSNVIDLTNVRLHKDDKKCCICLYKTDINKILLDYRYFKLIFPNTDEHEVSKNEKEIVYEALLKNFKDHGQIESYELLDIEYKNFKNWYSLIPFLWYSHGYHKERIFLWTLIFLGFISTFTYYNIDWLNSSAYKINHIPNLPDLNQISKSIHKTKLKRRRIWFSIMYSSVIFFLLLLKVENIKFKNWKGVVYLIVVYALGIICIAYTANYVLQK